MMTTLTRSPRYVPLSILFLLLFAYATGCRNTPVDALSSGDRASADLVTVPGVVAARSTQAGEPLDLALCAPDAHTFTADVTNPFYPLPVGRQWVLEGEEDDALLRVRVTVFDETEVVSGVTTRVIEEREWEDGEITEVSRNFFAQTEAGIVCYFGEDVDVYEDGEVASHDGSWRADDPEFAPGIFMPANPKVGMTYPLEFAPGVAEDEAEVLERGVQRVVLGGFSETLQYLGGRFAPPGQSRAPGAIHSIGLGRTYPTVRILESNPLDGDSGEKVFARGLGLIVDEALDLVSYGPADAQ